MKNCMAFINIQKLFYSKLKRYIKKVMSLSEKIIYEKKGRIAYITLNRPHKLNAIDFEMVRKLSDIWIDFRDDEEVWVAIITGAGGNFSAGFDVGNIASTQPKGGFKLLRDSAMFGEGPEHMMGPSRHSVWKPIIAALDGVVNGAGVWLALETDIKIATSDTKLGLFEGKINFPVEFAAFLTRHMPLSIAMELLITGNVLTAERAYQVGILNKVVAKEDLLKEAEKIANKICENGPLSVKVMKQLVRRSWDLNTEASLSLSEALIGPALSSEDFIEGITAFVEKRKAKWKGK